MEEEIESVDKEARGRLEAATSPSKSLNVMPTEILLVIFNQLGFPDLWRNVRNVSSRWRYIVRRLVLGHPTWLRKIRDTSYSRLTWTCTGKEVNCKCLEYGKEIRGCNVLQAVGIDEEYLTRYDRAALKKWMVFLQSGYFFVLREMVFDGTDAFPLALKATLCSNEEWTKLSWRDRDNVTKLSTRQQLPVMLRCFHFNTDTGELWLDLEPCCRAIDREWQDLYDENMLFSMMIEGNMWQSSPHLRVKDNLSQAKTEFVDLIRQSRQSWARRYCKDWQDLNENLRDTLVKYDNNCRKMAHFERMTLNYITANPDSTFEDQYQELTPSWLDLDPVAYIGDYDAWTIQHYAAFGHTLLHMTQDNFCLRRLGQEAFSISEEAYRNMFQDWFRQELSTLHRTLIVEEIEVEDTTDLDEYWRPLVAREENAMQASNLENVYFTRKTRPCRGKDYLWKDKYVEQDVPLYHLCEHGPYD